MLLIRQYRHPVRSYLWEAPAGLLDVDDEHPLVAAKRELLEEAHQVADTWHVLYDVYNSPGSSSEALRCYLARDLRPAPGDGVRGDRRGARHATGLGAARRSGRQRASAATCTTRTR